MLALLYLIIALVTGFAIVIALVPRVMQKKILTTAGERARNPVFALFPACFIAGTLAMIWLTYLTGWLLQNTEYPLGYANAVVMPVALIVSGIVIYRCRERVRFKALFRAMRPTTSEVVYMSASLAVATMLMFACFRVISGTIVIAQPVVEDYSLHLAFIRSFSKWQQVPAQYPLYTGAGVRYHFMFDFLAGNLELLGMRIDFAYNIPSILSMVAMFFAIYECFFRLCGRKNACHFVWAFVMFRSSLAFFIFAKENKGHVWRALKDNTSYLGATYLEDWGLFQPNALMNQRHLIFGFAAAFLVLSMFLPALIKGAEERKALRTEHRGGDYFKSMLRSQIPVKRKASVLAAVYCGLILGLSGYISGHSVIIALLMLCVFMFFSREMITHVITAAVSIVLVFLITHMFAGDSAVHVTLTHGWALPDKSLKAVATWGVLTLGLMLPLLLWHFATSSKVHRIVLIAGVVPMAFAFHVQLMQNQLQNHKMILFSLYWFAIQGGIAFVNLIVTSEKTRFRGFRRVIALLAFIPLTITGIYDFYMIFDKCESEKGYYYTSETPLLEWAKENDVDRGTVFLARDNIFTEINVAGLQNYIGHESMASDAGYDIPARQKDAEEIYNAPDEESLRAAVRRCGISYVVVTRRMRESSYPIDEELLAQVFPVVYTRGSGVYAFTVYDTGVR